MATPLDTPRRATILEVAKEAGASKTSVSRYFGGERERLSQGLQWRIASAAERLGYRPNQMARGLKGGHSRLVGMLVADIRNPFSVAVMHGVEQTCRAGGFSLLVCNTDNDPVLEREHLAMLVAYRVEGLIANVAGRPSRELSELVAQGVPLVLLDRELGDVEADVVGLDNALAIDMAFDHLQRQGYGELLYLSEPASRASSRAVRLARFRQRLAEAADMEGNGVEVDLGNSPHDLHRRLGEFLARPGKLSRAIVCGNGNLTLAVTGALQAMDVTLGETGLLGIDELDWCGLVKPGITTLAQPTEAIGRTAMESLAQRLGPADQGLPSRRIHFAPRLIVRDSTRIVLA